MDTKICLCMIVKNEAKIIERCLASVVGKVSHVLINDTGSTDGTYEIAHKFLAGNGITFYIDIEREFNTFAQARNDLLDNAREWEGIDPFEYLLLLDADMELKGSFGQLTAPAYWLVQRDGALGYRNVRLVRRDVPAKYVGVTHEYLSVEGVQDCNTAWVLDHGDGGSKGDKHQRDIRLLEEALRTEKDSGLKTRYTFYLAETKRHMACGMKKDGSFSEAAHRERLLKDSMIGYRQRASMGGYDEEAWYAMLGEATCLLELDDPKFLGVAWKAYNARPSRGEPLGLIARWHKDRDQHDAACAALELGLALPDCKDHLFVDKRLHDVGFAEEYGICGFRSADLGRRERARQACFALTTDPRLDPAARQQAVNNAVHHANGLDAEFVRLEFDVPYGYRTSTPSVVVVNDKLMAMVRAVNYSYDAQGPVYAPLDGTNVIRTKNFLCELDPDTLKVSWKKEVNDITEGCGNPQGCIRGFEDCRLFEVNGKLACSFTVCDRNDSERREMGLAFLQEEAGEWAFTDLRINRSIGPDKVQKNWMPCSDGSRFIYTIGQCVALEWSDDQPKVVGGTSQVNVDLSLLRGSSHLMSWQGGWLSITHEKAWLSGKQHYLHRFVKFSRDLSVIGVSDPFFFHIRGTEFCAGLARWRGKLLVSFSVDDSEAWVASFSEANLPRFHPVQSMRHLQAGDQVPITMPSAVNRPKTLPGRKEVASCLI